MCPELRFPEFNNEWEIKMLSEVAKVQRGRFSPRPRNDPRFYGGNTPFVQTGDVVTSGGYIKHYTQTLNEKGAKVSKVFPKGSLLITIAANIGYTGVLTEDMACPDSLIGLVPNDDTSNYYLNYYLSTQREHMDRVASVGAQKNINIDFLNPYPISWTVLPEQQKIADFLGSVDAWLDNLRQHKTALETYKRSMMQKLFTQQVRFKDDSGNDFPEWQALQMSDFGDSFGGLSGKSAEDFGRGEPYITYKQIFDHSFIEPSKFSLVYVAPKERQSRAQRGDILFTTSSETPEEVGFASVLIDDVNPYLNSFSFGFRPKSLNNLLPEYAKYHFRSALFRHKVIKLAQGSTRYNISKVQFMKLETELPTATEQKKIADFLSSIDQSITAKAEEITKAEQWKKGLMQKMFA